MQQKRAPGAGCGAIDGYNRTHAILGASEKCIAVQPSDMCVALVALEAVVRVEGRNGERTIRIADFRRLPGDTPEIDTNLKPAAAPWQSASGSHGFDPTGSALSFFRRAIFAEVRELGWPGR